MFEKIKRIPSDIHPWNKCAKFQPNPTIFEVSRLPPNYLGHTHTHTYPQILAQLKLRKTKGGHQNSIN